MTGDQRERVGVRDNHRAARYEAILDGEVVGVLIYERRPRSIELIHTVSAPEHRGEGVASVLARE